MKYDMVRIPEILLIAATIFRMSIPVSGNTIERIVAKVDQGIITLIELQEASQPSVEQIRQNYPPEEWDKRIREVRTQILNQMINEGVCLRFARDNKVEVTDNEVEATIMALRENAGIKTDEEFIQQLTAEGITLDELKENLKRQSIVRKVLRSEVYSKIRVTESDIRDYYMANSDQYQSKARVRVAVLIIDNEASGIFGAAAAEKKVRDVHAQLMNGADFAEMVRQHSDGPSPEKGGDIGFLEEGTALPVVEQTANKLNVGEFSEPLQTDFGWLIMKVLEKSGAGTKPLQDHRDEIEMVLREKKARSLEQEWFDRQRAMTYIEILDY